MSSEDWETESLPKPKTSRRKKDKLGEKRDKLGSSTNHRSLIF